MLFKQTPRIALIVVVTALLASLAPAGPADTPASGLLEALSWRHIGPFRGGRVVAATGVAKQPTVYYMGAVAGGVWKTEDAGASWQAIADDYLGSASVGAIAVSQSNPEVIYVGTGEACLRNNISYGDGIYRSKDAGKTWTRIGLSETQHIPRIRVHPANPDLVYVAALGNVHGENEQRGVFRSKDGGNNWEKILYVDAKTGASDLILDPSNPQIIYAGMWQVKHQPWGIFSGGPGSGLYKSSDGGDSWTELTAGLPRGEKGRIGVAVSPLDSSRVWALVEAEDGGVYRSDDGGQSWQLLNDGIQVRRRAYYYSHIYADTGDRDTVYVLTSPFLKSTDGGKTFESVQVPHGDTHELWIAPEDNQRMIQGNDGGATITFNGGRTWSTIYNQPTAQFYMVTTDNQFPYRVYGAQQDNSTVSITSRTEGRGIGPADFFSVGGGESGYIAPRPDNPDIIYAGSFWGALTRYDRRRDEVRSVQPWPEIPGGREAREWKYRFNWTFPILVSKHDPQTIFSAANVVFRSDDEGNQWRVISPDLTRDDKSKQTQRLTEIYDTIVSLAESPLQKGLLWAGSDDGLVHLTQDEGTNWKNVTPEQLEPWSRINVIEASPHSADKAYLAINRRKMGDFKPYIFKTSDRGRSWTQISNGIPADQFVRTVREDPVRPGLLFAGTERSVYVSLDDGENWQSLRLNMPVVPIADLAIHEDDVVAATHGRSFWILDNIRPLRQWTPGESGSAVLFSPASVYRLGFSFDRSGGPFAGNPARGAVLDYYFPEKPEGEVTIQILDEGSQLIQTYSSSDKRSPVPTRKGLNRFVWDLQYPDASGIKGGTFLFGGNLRGPLAIPGKYQVRLTEGGRSLTESFQIKKHPDSEATQGDFQAQFDFLMLLRERLSAAHQTVNEVLSLKEQLTDLEKQSARPDLLAALKDLGSRSTSVLDSIVEMQFRGIDDQMLIYPVKLNVKLSYLQRAAAAPGQPPSAQTRLVFDELSQQLDAQISQWKEIKNQEIPRLNGMLEKAGLPRLKIDTAAQPGIR